MVCLISTSTYMYVSSVWLFKRGGGRSREGGRREEVGREGGEKCITHATGTSIKCVQFHHGCAMAVRAKI